MKSPVLAIVVPCFNEEDVLPETFRRLTELIQFMIGDKQIDPASRVWYVDDGSKDRTWSLIEAAATNSAMHTCGVKLSRNRGHQIALLAGLMSAKGDALVSIDADLQDELHVIPKMVAEFQAGHDIVYGVRGSRKTDTFFKRASAEAYYKLLTRLNVEIVSNHADYRLMSRRAIEALRDYPESNVFLRGIIPQLGFACVQVEYTRQERFAGESKYPLGKMLSLAWQGVTSFSAAPLRAITVLGVAVCIFSVCMGLWALGVRLFTDAAVPGWASTVIPLFLISGAQLLSLGVIGEYLAKVYIETKRRPLYFIDQLIEPSSAMGTIRNAPLPVKEAVLNG